MLDLSGRRIICLGDVMLDRFLYGDASRLSPEAPVPVVRLSRTQSMAGGAGNVARNITALGGSAGLIGLVGEDAEGAEIAALLGAAAHLLRSPARRTTVKLRVIAARQQVVRVDEEERREADAAEEAAIAARLEALLPVRRR
jgi:D-beta-D-heptose 7-phosphate kinase / D-beta-D-heptose 1-phosphate adenosyltransferase